MIATLLAVFLLGLVPTPAPLAHCGDHAQPVVVNGAHPSQMPVLDATDPAQCNHCDPVGCCAPGRCPVQDVIALPAAPVMGSILHGPATLGLDGAILHSVPPEPPVPPPVIASV